MAAGAGCLQLKDMCGLCKCTESLTRFRSILDDFRPIRLWASSSLEVTVQT